MKSPKVALWLLPAVLVLASCAPKKPVMRVQIANTKADIKLKLGPGNATVVVDDGPNCSDGSKGCVKVPLNNTGTISYDLIVASWHLKELRICKGNAKDDADLDCSFNLFERFEFIVSNMAEDKFVFMDGNGTFDLSDLDPGDFKDIQEFILLDNNTVAKKYFYIIEACRDNNPGVCRESDPIIENDGRGIGAFFISP